jgi:hypothetical protein
MIIWEWKDDVVALLITMLLSTRMKMRRRKRRRRCMMMIGHHHADDYDRYGSSLGIILPSLTNTPQKWVIFVPFRSKKAMWFPSCYFVTQYMI